VGARPLLASAKRSRIVLLADSGKQDLEIAAELGISNQKAAPPGRCSSSRTRPDFPRLPAVTGY
jgi:hypothetical protein